MKFYLFIFLIVSTQVFAQSRTVTLSGDCVRIQDGPCIDKTELGLLSGFTATAGGIVYSDSDSFEVLATGPVGYILQSNGASAPSWVAHGTPSTLSVWVDKNRVDTYTEDGSYQRPYKSLAAMYAAINDATSSKKYIAYIVPGAYVESNTLVLEAFIELVAGDNEAVTIERTDGTDIPIDCTSANKRIAIRNISFTDGLTVDKTGTTTEGCIILISNTDIYGTFTFNGIGGGVDFVTFRDSRVFSSVTINAVSSSVFASILYGTNTFGTVGGTNADIYGSMAFADIQNSYLWDIAFDVETGMDGYYQIARSSVGNTLDADALGTGTMTIVPDSVSMPTSSANYTPTGSVTLGLATRAHALGYSPLVSGDWSVVPNDVAEALDYLSANMGTGSLTSINGATGPAIIFDSGSTGTDFNIASAGNTITYHLPTASASVTGKIASADWSTFNDKVAGQASSVDGEIALFSSTTGKVIRQATGTGFVTATSGVYGTTASIDLVTYSSGILPLNRGGTNKSITASNGALVYTDSDSQEILPIGTNGQYLTISSGLPAWTSSTPSSPDVEIVLYQTNGYGSTGTMTRRWVTVLKNTGGSDMTLTQSATDGDSITINTSGVYCTTVQDNFTAGNQFGVTFNVASNQSMATTNSSSLDKVIAAANGPAFDPAGTGGCRRLTAGDVVRAQTQGTAADAATRSRWALTKIN